MGGDQCRVEVCEDGSVLIYNLEYEKLHLNSIEDLPKWIQGRVAVLSILPDLSEVDGVGYKLNDNVFWINVP